MSTQEIGHVAVHPNENRPGKTDSTTRPILAPGKGRRLYLGYRKMTAGEGTWIARWKDENDKQHFRALGRFNDFDEAVKEALAWFDQNEGGTSPKVSTVEAACKDYVEHLRTHKSKATANDAEGRFNRLVYGKKIAGIALDKLKSSDVRKWLNAQLADVDDEDAEDMRRAKDSANRNLASFKAALNFALKSHLVATDAAWKTVTPFPRSGKRRERFLTLDERKRLLAACPEDLRMLVHALLVTAARPGEIEAATVGNFDKKAGTLALDGKTGRRIVSLSSAALEFFTKAAKGKLPTAFLVARADGSQWNKGAWKKHFRQAVKTAGLPDDVVLYSLRHTAISEMIASGIDSFIVARLAGTSTQMIDKHYGHLRHDRTRAKLDMARMI